MILEPFKIPIYTKELILDNKALASYCLNNRKSNKGRVLSNDGGWQSENLYTYLQGEKYPQPISELCNDILTIAIEFARTIDMIDKLEILDQNLHFGPYIMSCRLPKYIIDNRP